MKTFFVLSSLLGALTLLGSLSAWAGDTVMMATSEDLSAFDAQLGVEGATADKKKIQTKAAGSFGAAISAEAKKMQEKGLNPGFGKSVSEQARGQSVERSENRSRDQSATQSLGKKNKK